MRSLMGQQDETKRCINLEMWYTQFTISDHFEITSKYISINVDEFGGEKRCSVFYELDGVGQCIHPYQLRCATFYERSQG